MQPKRPKEKLEPEYDLEKVKLLVNSDDYIIIEKAVDEALEDFHYNDFEIIEEIKSLDPGHFIKSQIG